jgi:hypothetical protein
MNFYGNNSLLISTEKAISIAWSPEQLDQSLALWLDASDFDTITLNGSTVSSWRDKLNNDLSMTQNTQTQQPLYVENQLNNKAIIRTDGVNDFISLLKTWSLESRTTLPDGGLGSEPGKGWTGTGLFYDAIENVWWVSNDGRKSIGSPQFPSIIKMNFEATTILEQIDIKAIYPDNTTVQGLVIDPQNDSVWFAAQEQNKLRNITKTGVSLGELSFTAPNGLSYDPLNNTLIVLSGTTVSVVNKTNGSVLRTYSVAVTTPDHLYFDPLTRRLYVSYEDGGAGSVAICNHDTGAIIGKIGPFEEAVAIEGISIIDNNIYIMNDAYFHTGPVPLNQILYYTFITPISSNINIFAVGKARSLTSTARGWYYAGAGPITSLGWGAYPILNDQTMRIFVNGGSAVSANFTVSGSATTSYAITTLLINQLTKVTSFATNGGSGVTFATSGIDTLPLIGGFTLGRGEANGRYSTSDTAEIIITNSDIATVERQKIEGYLAHKWGLQTNLPNDHPYKNIAP